MPFLEQVSGIYCRATERCRELLRPSMRSEPRTVTSFWSECYHMLTLLCFLDVQDYVDLVKRRIFKKQKVHCYAIS